MSKQAPGFGPGEPTPRKAIQLLNIPTTGPTAQIVVLCDDGSIWVGRHPFGDPTNLWEWVRFLDIPQD